MQPSLFRRIAIGKTIGLIIGLIGFFMLPTIWPEVDQRLLVGIILWYTTFGMFIAVMGVITYHPVLHLPMPWWFRSGLLGGWLNLVLVLFAYKDMEQVLLRLFGESYSSPYLFVIEGILIGQLIGFVATKFAGEGKESVDI